MRGICAGRAGRQAGRQAGKDVGIEREGDEMGGREERRLGWATGPCDEGKAVDVWSV